MMTLVKFILSQISHARERIIMIKNKNIKQIMNGRHNFNLGFI